MTRENKVGILWKVWRMLDNFWTAGKKNKVEKYNIKGRHQEIGRTVKSRLFPPHFNYVLLLYLLPIIGTFNSTLLRKKPPKSVPFFFI